MSRPGLQERALLLTDTQSTFQRMVPIVQADAQKIGITFHVRHRERRLSDARDHLEEHRDRVFPGWFKDYADALTFFSPLFDGRNDHRARETRTTRSSG